MLSRKEWFEEKSLKVVKDITVLWSGWDCDNVWYLCEDKELNKVLVVSNHGSLEIGKIEELEQKIEEYKEILEDSEIVLKILKGESSV